ncbi:hypothetical protein [Kitasatospora camelliae]|uniref:Uncharacterized protein n=1 Tax=Kitasatospora camelliae TaxID=3156397 RepID=A0AAU8K6U5_9ACTN
MSSLTVTPANLRKLLASGADNPVLFVNRDVDYEPELAVWDAAYVDKDTIVITLPELIDWLGDDFTDDDAAEYLPELQETVDEIEPAPGPHFTAWVTTTPSCLAGDNADVVVLADTFAGYRRGKVEWESGGGEVFTAVTEVDAREGDDADAIRESEELLEAAGWRITGDWEGLDPGYIATVERQDEAETWTLQQATDHMKAANTNTAQRALKRLGIEPVGRAPGRGGQNLYLTVQVMYAHATRPGQGARTDLKDTE